MVVAISDSHNYLNWGEFRAKCLEKQGYDLAVPDDVH